MTKAVYECMYILDANAFARDPNGASSGIGDMIESAGGEILASRLWNEQKLAYPIKGRYKGAYWLTYFRLDSEALTKFNRACQLNDLVLRHLIIKIDPRVEATLIAAAKGEIEESPPVETEAVATEGTESDEASEGKTPAAVIEDETATVDT